MERRAQRRPGSRPKAGAVEREVSPFFGRLMSRTHVLLISALFLFASAEARAQGVGVAWTKVPSVIVVGRAGDARARLVHAAVAHWNSTLSGIGSAFRLGPVAQRGSGGAAEPGKIVVVLSDEVFVSHADRSPDGEGAVVMIRTDRVPPLSMPNVARNVIAHELGHAIGLRHDSDPAMLMCGRPAPCRPDVFVSATPRYFPLSSADRASLLAMYPPNWKGR